MKIEHGECECDEERPKTTIMMITLEIKLKATERHGERKIISIHNCVAMCSSHSPNQTKPTIVSQNCDEPEKLGENGSGFFL